VGASLFLQIVLSMFSMFSRRAWPILILVFVLAVLGGVVLQQKVIAPFLERETGGDVVPRN
jgi:hypothetical protein